MPCQKVIATGAALVLATAVAAPETAVAATGAMAVANAETVGAADATAGATAAAVAGTPVAAAATVGATAVAAAAEVGATAVAVALTLVAAGATCVGAFGGALVHATATRHIRIGIRIRARISSTLLKAAAEQNPPWNGRSPAGG